MVITKLSRFFLGVKRVKQYSKWISLPSLLRRQWYRTQFLLKMTRLP